MNRYVGLDAHAKTCTLAVVSRSGKRLKSLVVETNGHALVEAVKGIAGDVHLCLEEGTQSGWLHEILSPHTCELVVSVPEKKRGPKDDLRDAWSRAEDIRVGRVQTRVYKAPRHLAGMRCAACAYRLATQAVVRTKNRLKAVFRSRGDSVERRSLRGGVARPVAEATPVWFSGARGLAWAGVGRTGPPTGRGGGVASEGSEDATERSHSQATSPRSTE
jgi:hypothetical protein